MHEEKGKSGFDFLTSDYNVYFFFSGMENSITRIPAYRYDGSISLATKSSIQLGILANSTLTQI